MARQFYDGYPQIYDRAKNLFDDCEDIKNDRKCKEREHDDCKCREREHKECRCERENEHKECRCEKENECFCEHERDDCNCASRNFLSGFNLDSIFNNFNIDDIILLAIALVLLHDGTDDTLLLIIIGVIFLVGLT